MIEFAGLELPETCPACSAKARQEQRHHVLRMFSVTYDCDAVLSARYIGDGPDHMVSASVGCRASLDKMMHPNV